MQVYRVGSASAAGTKQHRHTVRVWIADCFLLFHNHVQDTDLYAAGCCCMMGSIPSPPHVLPPQQTGRCVLGCTVPPSTNALGTVSGNPVDSSTVLPSTPPLPTTTTTTPHTDAHEDASVNDHATNAQWSTCPNELLLKVRDCGISYGLGGWRGLIGVMTQSPFKRGVLRTMGW